MKKIPLSISKFMDQMRNSKLIEIRSEEPERYIRAYNRNVDPFNAVFKMEPYEIQDAEVIMNLIKSYAKESD